MERDGIKIGLFSIIGKNADHVAPKAEPVTFAKQTAVAKKMVKELKEDKLQDYYLYFSFRDLKKKKRRMGRRGCGTCQESKRHQSDHWGTFSYKA